MANPLAALGQVLAGLTTAGAQGARGALEGTVEGIEKKSKLDAEAEQSKLRALQAVLYDQEAKKGRLPWDEIHGTSLYTRYPLTGELRFSGMGPLDPLKEAQIRAANARATLDTARIPGVAHVPTETNLWARIGDKMIAGTATEVERGLWKQHQRQEGATETSLWARIGDKVVAGTATEVERGLWKQHQRQDQMPHYDVPHFERDDKGNVVAIVPQRDANGAITGYTRTPQGQVGAERAAPSPSKERLQLIAQGEIKDPQISPAGAARAIQELEAAESRRAGARAKAGAEARGEVAAHLLTPDTIEREAYAYIQSGKLPSLRFGGYLGQAKIMNRGTELSKELGIPFNEIVPRQLAQKAAASGLTRLESNRAPIMAFAKTAEMNLDIALEMSNKVDRTGIQAVNSFLQTGRRQFGNREVSDFAAAVDVAVRETARVTSGSMTGVTTDANRREIGEWLNTKQTPEQFFGALQILKRDINSRRLGYERQIEEAKASLNWLKGGSPSADGMRDAVGPDGKEGRLPATTDLSQWPGYRWKAGTVPSLSAPPPPLSEDGPALTSPPEGGLSVLPPPAAAPGAPPLPPSSAPRMPTAPPLSTAPASPSKTSLPPIPESANPAYVKALVREVLATHFKGLLYVDLHRVPGALEQFDEILKQRYWSSQSKPTASTPPTTFSGPVAR
jgi:hypothetical protein